MTESTPHDDVVPGPAGNDVLSDALNAFRVTGAHRGVAQIAEDVDYGSEAALSRAFKRETGLTPAEWRGARR